MNGDWIAKNEILGEARLWIDSSIDTYSLTEAGFRFQYMNSESGAIIQKMMQAITINDYIALPAYLLYRMSELFNYLGDSTPSHLQSKISFLPKLIGITGACLAALTAGGSAAEQLYAADIGFENTAGYAKTLTPYIFAFYTADAFLRNSLFKDRVLNYMFVKRYDDVETKNVRESLIEKLRASKAVIASLSDEELSTIDLNKIPVGMTGNAERLSGIDTLQNLVDIGKDKTQKRSSIAAHEKKVNHYFNIQTFIEKKWPLILGLLLAIGGAYLSYNGARSNFDNAAQMKFTSHSSMPDFSNMGTSALQQRSIIAYQVWEEDTKDVVVYDGIGTDWCTQCRESTHYSKGNIEDGGTFVFTNCPGLGTNSVCTSNPGDWNYTDYNCGLWFNFADHYLASLAGIPTDDYYAPAAINSLTLSPTAQGLSITAAVLLATMSASLAALSTSDAVRRISDAFSSHPEEILQGKRSKWMNAATLSVSAIQSLIRATPAGVAGWYTMQSTSIDPNFMWLIVGLTTVSAGMTYLNDFDDAYARMPTAFRKGYAFTKNSLLGALGISHGTTKNSHVICDDLIEKANKIIGVIESAPKDIVMAVKQGII